MKYALSDFTLGIECLLRGEKDLKAVTVFCNPLNNVKARVRVTRRHKPDSRRNENELIVTFGGLNYSEREFVKKCKKAKCKPRKVHFWFYPKKR